jgi:polysaccharide export outer membrane protein
MRRILSILIIAPLLCSCGSYLSAYGPSSSDIRQGPVDQKTIPYALIPLTASAAEVLARNIPRLGTFFTDRRPPDDIRFGVGDVVSVTIFEAAAGGLFIPADAGTRPGNFISLPNQNVDNKGNISVPYAGPIAAKGRTPAEVQNGIVAALNKRAIEPQAVVSLVDQRTSMISVLGEVNKPDRFPARAAGERILDAISRAGGPKGQGYDTWVMLDRAERREIVPFGALVYEPSNNIYVHPNDTIYLYNEPQTFLAFGAVAGNITSGVSTTVTGISGVVGTTAQGQYNFNAWRISLTEAVAKAGGMSDLAADPSSVFIYRGETRQVAAQLGIDVSKFTGPVIPVIYNANLRDPAGFFLASKFQMRNKDIIYVSNSESVEVDKFLIQVNSVIGTINDPIVTATNAYLLRNVANTKTGAAVVTGGTLR